MDPSNKEIDFGEFKFIGPPQVSYENGRQVLKQLYRLPDGKNRLVMLKMKEGIHLDEDPILERLKESVMYRLADLRSLSEKGATSVEWVEENDMKRMICKNAKGEVIDPTTTKVVTASDAHFGDSKTDNPSAVIHPSLSSKDPSRSKDALGNDQKHHPDHKVDVLPSLMRGLGPQEAQAQKKEGSLTAAERLFTKCFELPPSSLHKFAEKGYIALFKGYCQSESIDLKMTPHGGLILTHQTIDLLEYVLGQIKGVLCVDLRHCEQIQDLGGVLRVISNHEVSKVKLNLSPTKQESETIADAMIEDPSLSVMMSHSDQYFKIACQLEEMGFYDLAIHCAELAISIEQTVAKTAPFLKLIGDLYWKIHQLKSNKKYRKLAVEYYEKSMACDREYYPAYLSLGAILTSREDSFEETKTFLNKASSVFKDKCPELKILQARLVYQQLRERSNRNPLNKVRLDELKGLFTLLQTALLDPTLSGEYRNQALEILKTTRYSFGELLDGWTFDADYNLIKDPEAQTFIERIKREQRFVYDASGLPKGVNLKEYGEGIPCFRTVLSSLVDVGCYLIELNLTSSKWVSFLAALIEKTHKSKKILLSLDLDPIPLCLIGENLKKQGSLDLALIYLKKTIALDPKPSLRSRAERALGLVYMQKTDDEMSFELTPGIKEEWDLALQHCSKAIEYERDPFNFQAYANVYLEKGEYDKALLVLNLHLPADPALMKYFVCEALSQAYTQTRKSKYLKKWIETANQLFQDPAFFFLNEHYLSSFCFQRDGLEVFLKRNKVKTSLPVVPQRVQFRMYLNQSYNRNLCFCCDVVLDEELFQLVLAKLFEAYQNKKNRFKVALKDPSTSKKIAETVFHSEYFAKSLFYYNQALSLEDSTAEKSLLLTRIASVYLRLGSMNFAIQYFREALALDHLNFAAHMGLAQAFGVRKPQFALGMLRKLDKATLLDRKPILLQILEISLYAWFKSKENHYLEEIIATAREVLATLDPSSHTRVYGVLLKVQESGVDLSQYALRVPDYLPSEPQPSAPPLDESVTIDNNEHLAANPVDEDGFFLL
jgi:tetratricopeptide (TPR) repeat protein